MLALTLLMMTTWWTRSPQGQGVGGLVPRCTSGHAGGAHLFGAIVLDKSVQWDHTVDLQQHRGGAQLLLAWAAAEVTGRRTAAFLLTADLYTWDELVIRQHLGCQQAWEVGDEGHGLQLLLAAQLRGLWRKRDKFSKGQKVRLLNPSRCAKRRLSTKKGKQMTWLMML